MFERGLGDDEWTKRKMYFVLVILALATFYYFMLINVPEQFTANIGFLFMIIIPFIALIIDHLSKNEVVDTITEEDPSHRPFGLDKIPTWGIWAIAGALVLINLFNASRTSMAIVMAPTYQAIQIFADPWVKAILSGIWGIGENFFVFSFVFPTLFSFLRIKFNPIVAYLAFPLTAGFFTMMHFLIYGSAMLPASWSTFLFGLTCCALFYLFRSSIIAGAYHFSNNFILHVFKIVRFGFI